MFIFKSLESFFSYIGSSPCLWITSYVSVDLIIAVLWYIVLFCILFENNFDFKNLLKANNNALLALIILNLISLDHTLLVLSIASKYQIYCVFKS